MSIYEVNALDTLTLEGSCSCCAPRSCTLGWGGSIAQASITFDNDRIHVWSDVPRSCSDRAIEVDPFGGDCHGYVLTRVNGV